MFDRVLTQLDPNAHLLVIACLGGLILFGLQCAEHYNRPEPDKLHFWKYIRIYVLLLVVLPGLGVIVMSVYLLNGDKISPVLALQIGLTSPAIVQSMIIAAANQMATSARRETTQGQ